VAREKDDNNADQHCSQVHLRVHILLPATVSLMRLRRRRGMWHVRKTRIMQTCTMQPGSSHSSYPSSFNSFIDEVEKKTRHVASEKDNDKTDQHCSQVHLTVHILLPVTVSSMRLRRRRGMWHVRKTTTMQTSTAAIVSSQGSYPSSCNNFINEIELETRHVPREEDDDNADLHHAARFISRLISFSL
jgi:hypothetical protein